MRERSAAIGKILLDHVGVALSGTAIAAGTGSDDLDRIAGVQHRSPTTGEHHAIAEFEGAAPTCFAAGQPPGWGEQPRPVDPQLAIGLGAVDPP